MPYGKVASDFGLGSCYSKRTTNGLTDVRTANRYKTAHATICALNHRSFAVQCIAFSQ